MAWLEQNRPNGPYQLVVRYGIQRLKRSTRTTDTRRANEISLRADRRLEMLERGELALPEDVDVLTFLMSDGSAPNRTKPAASVTLETVCEEHRKSLPDGAMEKNSLLTTEIHIKHLRRLLGACTRLRDINRQSLQTYVNTRAAENGRNGKIRTATIKKELTTLGTIWRYALSAGYVGVPYPNRELKFPKPRPKARFQTWQEIEAQIAEGGLTEVEQAELWATLFLTLPEIAELLASVLEYARHPFLFPMVMTATHTGARRSELVRSLRTDFDLKSGMVTLREKKRVPGEYSTRIVPMSQQLRQAIRDWFKVHPGGRHTFCIGSNVARSRFKCDTPEPLTVFQAHDHLKRVLIGKWSRVRGWHVFRHSFASNCAAQRVDQRIINTWMGHQTEDMVRRYRHLIPDQQHQAIQSVFGAV